MIDSAVIIFSASSINSDILCIIRCLQSKSAVIAEIVATPINFQICGYRRARTSF